MTVDPRSLSGQEEQLGQVIFTCLQALDRGEPLDREGLFARYPELAAELAEFFAGREEFDRLAEPLRSIAQAVRGAAGAAESLVVGAAPAGLEGGVLGDYKLGREIGRGGMGIVYEAEQISPGRRVALKVLPFAATMDPRQLQRFHNEARAAAGLHHTNIVPVYGVGCERGVHYYAMQFIDGQTLADFIAAQRSGPLSQVPAMAALAAATVPPAAQTTSAAPRDAAYFRRAAEWGIQAVEALDCAHSLGVVHRDMKPANLMVDAAGRLWITDFGLAQVQSDVRLTMTGDLVGTLRYMSPEQALGKRMVIDHRTDIYSLGATLYELLTLRPAFDGKDRQELLRQIAFEEPPRLRRLDRRIPVELETVVTKAMEKNPTDRYATAKELADDLRRWLDDRPIQARRPTLIQRTRKWFRRHPAVLRSAVAMLLLAVAGLTIASYLIWQEKGKKEAALELAEKRREAAENAEQIAREKEQEAVALQKRAIELRNKFLDALRQTTDADVEKLIGAKKQLGAHERAYLEAIAKRWQALAAQEGTDEEARALRAEGTFRVALLWQKLGRKEEARSAFEQARDLHARLAEQYPDEANHHHGLAATYHELGLLLSGLGEHEKARGAYECARDTLQSLVEKVPNRPFTQQSLLTNHLNMRNLLRDLGKLNEARIEYEQARDIGQKLAIRFPAESTYQRDLAMSHNNLGAVFVDLGQRERAGVEFKKALDINATLAEKLPAVLEYRNGLARGHSNLGVLLYELGKRKEAQAEFLKSLAIRQKLAEQFPTLHSYQVELGTGLLNLGSCIRDEGKPAESLEWFAKAISTLMPVHQQEPRDEQVNLVLRTSYRNRAIALDRLHKHAEAVKDWDKAIELSGKAKGEQAGYRVARVNSRVKAGQVAEAVAEVAELTKAGEWNAGQWYDIACVYAVASGKVADRKQEYAARAMELLGKAVTAGWKDAAHMARDTDLDALRDREDFQKLPTKLQVGKVKGKDGR